MSAVIDFKSSVLEKFSRFCLNPLNSDVVLVVGNDRIPAHRFVLAALSDFFQDLLFGEGRNKSGEMILETNSGVLKVLLKFMYTGILNFEDLEFDDVLRLLELAHRFQLQEVELAVSEYLHAKIDAKTAVSVMEMVPLMGHEELQEKACFIVEMAIEGICQLERLPKVALLKILDRSSRKVSERKLLRELLKHVDSLTQKEKQMILPKVQFSKLTHEQLIDLSIPEEIIPMSVLVEKSKELSLHKAQKRVGKYSFGPEAMALTGDGKEFIFKIGDNFTSNPSGKPIVIDLGALYILNHIQFQLKVLKKKYKVQYRIEVSLDHHNWTEIVSSTTACYSGTQKVYFPEITLRYIKMSGVKMVFRKKSKKTTQGALHINSIKMYYIENHPKSFGGLIYPEKIVTVEPRSCVHYCDFFGSLNQLKSTLLEGNLFEYSIMTPYTYQIMEDGPLVVFFIQPYILDSCRFRLWDYDGRKYGYKVDVYSDGKFEVVSDCGDELLDGWQIITFTPRAVAYFRIWGKQCSNGKELRLVHFEAPASKPDINKNNLH